MPETGGVTEMISMVLRCGEWVVLVGLVASVAHAQPKYEVVDLGSAGESTDTYSHALSPNGLVVGEIKYLFGDEAPFLWRDGVLLALPNLPGSSNGAACGVNSAGQVVGTSDSRAFLWEDGVIIDIGLLPDATQAFAYDINESGQIVGYSGDNVYGTPPNHPFIWQDGVMTDLGLPDGYDWAKGFAINELGQVTGNMSLDDSSESHAFLYSDGVFIDLGILPGDTRSKGEDINDLGQVVGWSWAPGSLGRGVLWDKGEAIEIEGLPETDTTELRTINNSTQIVGISEGASGGGAFLWENGVTYRLSDLIVDTTGWYSVGGTIINDAGQIAGSGLIDEPFNPAHAALLNPIIEPPCEGDVNDDGVVDPLDTGFVLARFGCSVNTGDPDCDASDLNGDALVNPLDAGFVLARFGPCD